MKQITELDDTCVWHVTAPEGPDLAPLTGELDTDTVIVGAGYTGLVTALRLAERGHDVVVLEAKQVGFGGSGRNLGHCTPTFAFWPYEKIQKIYGADYAERIIRMQTGAADQVFGLIEKYQIRCEAVRNGYLRVAGTPNDVAGLEHARDTYGRYGLKSRMLDPAETEDLSGSPRFHGGWLLEGAGHLNPLGYARGLARAAVSQGAQIFVDSPVQTLERDSGGWRIGTAQGGVRAKNVLLATGAYTLGPPWPKLTSSYFKVGVAGLATSPLDPALRAQVLKHNHSIVSSQGDPVFYRWTQDNRFVTTVRSLGALGNDPERTKSFMTEKTEWLFPALKGLAWDHYWFGLLDAQYRTLPRIFRLDDGVYACLGFSGRGVPTATAAGSVLADLLSGSPSGDLSLPVEPFRRSLPGLAVAQQIHARWGAIKDRIRYRFNGTLEPPPVI